MYTCREYELSNFQAIDQCYSIQHEFSLVKHSLYDRKWLVSLITAILLFCLWTYIAWKINIVVFRIYGCISKLMYFLHQWHIMHIPVLWKFPASASWWEGSLSNQDWFVLNPKICSDFCYKVLQCSYDKHPRVKSMPCVVWMPLGPSWPVPHGKVYHGWHGPNQNELYRQRKIIQGQREIDLCYLTHLDHSLRSFVWCTYLHEDIKVRKLKQCHEQKSH